MCKGGGGRERGAWLSTTTGCSLSQVQARAPPTSADRGQAKVCPHQALALAVKLLDGPLDAVQVRNIRHGAQACLQFQQPHTDNACTHDDSKVVGHTHTVGLHACQTAESA